MINNEFNIKATGRIAVITEKQVEQAHKNHLALYSGLMLDKSKAIEKMAKAIHFYEWGHHNNMPKWDELNGDIQNDYRNMAGSALNALLEGDK